MSKREENKRQNKEVIINGARNLFASKGLDNTNISEIVEASGLARGTFYNYFKSKEEIWDELLHDFALRLNTVLNAERKNAATPQAFIQDAFKGYLELLKEPQMLSFIVKNQEAVRKGLLSSDNISSIYRDLENDLKNSTFFEGLSTQQYQLISYAMIGAGLEIVILSFYSSDVSIQETEKFFTQLFLGGIDKMLHEK